MEETATRAVHEKAFVVLDANVLLDLYGYPRDDESDTPGDEDVDDSPEGGDSD